MNEREKQLEDALALILITNQAISLLRRKHGSKAAEDRKRTVVREFNFAIESARNLLAERRNGGVPVSAAGLTLDANDTRFLAARLRRLFEHFGYPLPEFASDDARLIGIAGAAIGALLTGRTDGVAPSPAPSQAQGKPVPEGCTYPDCACKVSWETWENCAAAAGVSGPRGETFSPADADGAGAGP